MAPAAGDSPVCEVDRRVGGDWRSLFRGPAGAENSSPEIRDAVARSPMERGAGEGYDRLAALLTVLPSQPITKDIPDERRTSPCLSSRST